MLQPKTIKQLIQTFNTNGNLLCFFRLGVNTRAILLHAIRFSSPWSSSPRASAGCAEYPGLCQAVRSEILPRVSREQEEWRQWVLVHRIGRSAGVLCWNRVWTSYRSDGIQGCCSGPYPGPYPGPGEGGLTIYWWLVTTVEPVLKDMPLVIKNVVSLVTDSFTLGCSTFCQNHGFFKTGSLPWQWSVKARFTV